MCYCGSLLSTKSTAFHAWFHIFVEIVLRAQIFDCAWNVRRGCPNRSDASFDWPNIRNVGWTYEHAHINLIIGHVFWESRLSKNKLGGWCCSELARFGRAWRAISLFFYREWIVRMEIAFGPSSFIVRINTNCSFQRTDSRARDVTTLKARVSFPFGVRRAVFRLQRKVRRFSHLLFFSVSVVFECRCADVNGRIWLRSHSVS